MSIRNWYKNHRKKVITHTSIIVGLVLFIVLGTEPLFDRLERIPGEAQLYQLQLPAVTNDIRFKIDEITVHSHTIFYSGWAFIEGHDVDLARSRTYLVLKSDRHTYIFDTAPKESPRITTYFEGLGLNLDWAGFVTNIPVRKIASGEYILGLCITKDDIQALQYTDKGIVKAGNIVKLTVRMSEEQKIPLPQELGEIRFGDNLKPSSNFTELKSISLPVPGFV